MGETVELFGGPLDGAEVIKPKGLTVRVPMRHTSNGYELWKPCREVADDGRRMPAASYSLNKGRWTCDGPSEL